MKKRIYYVCLSLFFALTGCSAKQESENDIPLQQPAAPEPIEISNVLIFGDSYSTFKGYIPKQNLTYYPSYNVIDVEQTWWMQVIERADANLVLNDSWSGSTICNTGYDGVDCSKTNSFIYRYEKLCGQGFFDTNEIDTLFVFGGTNDSWAGAPLGERMTSGWTAEDLRCVLPAICYFMDTLKDDLPDANIIFILNSDLKEEISSCMRWAAEYFGVTLVELQDVEKRNGHPTMKGMTTICNEIAKVLHWE